MKTYQSGNTVRLSCIFRGFNDEDIDPTLIKVKFYDYKHNLLEEISIGQENKDIDGSYFYDYVIPDGHKKIIYEWYGEIDGLPSIKRDFILTEFI